MKTTNSSNWLALMIGNSRLHWALYHDNDLRQTWDTPHLSADASISESNRQATDRLKPLPPDLKTLLLTKQLPLTIASVVPAQTALWQTYPRCHFITLEQIPLQGLYPTLGIDRALALWGAIQTQNAPVLVIDAGTALTLTGADAAHRLIGGAILPGLRLQFQTLAIGTAALPAVEQNMTLPPRWATNTSEAIQSGILYTLLAGIRDFMDAWLQSFPNSAIVLTGGDADFLIAQFRAIDPIRADRMAIDPHLIFGGMRSLRPNECRQDIVP